MAQPTLDTVAVGHPARRAAASAVGLAVLSGALFTAFAVLTTQDKVIRAASPWQDDPYATAVSFTEFLVPALTVLILLRLALWRPKAPLPRFRVDQLLRAAMANLVLIGATVLTDWIAVAVRADRPLWNSTTSSLITALGVLSVVSVCGCETWRRARRQLPAGHLDGDWLDDLAQLVDLALAKLTVRPVDLRGPIAVLRRHIVAFALGLSLFGGLAVTAAEVIGEGWGDPVLLGTRVLVGAGGFFAFCLISDATLHIALPRRPRGALGVAVVLGCVGLPVSVSLREAIWAALGQRGGVRTPTELALVTVGGAVVLGLLSLLAARAARRAG